VAYPRMLNSKNGTRIYVGDIWYAKIGDSIILEEIRLEEVTDHTVSFSLRIDNPAGFRQRPNTSIWNAPQRYAIADIKFVELKSPKLDA
jgi:hypothetical protein